jgi:hypothetical protein
MKMPQGNGNPPGAVSRPRRDFAEQNRHESIPRRRRGQAESSESFLGRPMVAGVV